MGKKVMVFAAHPDDEVLGCGGTIAKHIENGDDVHIIILAEGLTSRDNQRKRENHLQELNLLAQASETAASVLGGATVRRYDFPDNRMDGVELLEVVKCIEKCIDSYQPEIIYTHHMGDVNVDHRITHQAVVVACRPQNRYSVKEILFFETPSSTEWQVSGSEMPFVPNWFIDISGTLNKKLEALQAYSSEMRSWPHPRSLEGVEHLAKWRGACVGVDACEAFVLGRKIE